MTNTGAQPTEATKKDDGRLPIAGEASMPPDGPDGSPRGRRIIAAGYVNGDDCFLAWMLPYTPDCWGFAIWRDRVSGKQRHEFRNVHNRVGFAQDKPKPFEHRASTEWPFQRYTWTDHGVSQGDTVTYTITPMIKGPTELIQDKAKSAKVGPLTVTSAAGESVHAYFNRGIVMSQFIARRLGNDFTKSDVFKLKKQLAANDNSLRKFLMGQLGTRLIDLVEEAVKKKRWHVYVALYELADRELIKGLASLGARAHLVLSNGSKRKKGTDGNAKAARQLDGVIDMHRRMLWSEGLGHNKFLVLARSRNRPVAVWTGSTNWATTGLCTQMNNAVFIEDAEVAQIYLEQWKRLRDDRRTSQRGKFHFGETLMKSNDAAKVCGPSDGQYVVWFTRTRLGADLDAATDLIKRARHAILFLMFEPGTSGLLQVIQSRLSQNHSRDGRGLYVHGVVNTLRNDGRDVQVKLVGRGRPQTFRLKVVQPEGVGENLANWAREVARDDFLVQHGGQIGHAIVHSKAIVLDPFTNPVVITGSHNFSRPASRANDENLLFIKGNRELAQRYAVNIMSTYQHFRWRAYLQQCAAEHRRPWQHLMPGDWWQKRMYSLMPELSFWVQKPLSRWPIKTFR